MPEFITITELANYLRVNKRTIYRLLWRGDIPAVRIGRQWRFEKRAIDEWLHRYQVQNEVNILVIDDEGAICSLFTDTLSKLSYNVETARDGNEGLKLAKQSDYDVIFVDLKMPGMDGSEILRNLRTIKPDTPVCIITGYPDSEIMNRALAQAPFAVMKKPFEESDIVTALKRLLPANKISIPNEPTTKMNIDSS